MIDWRVGFDYPQKGVDIIFHTSNKPVEPLGFFDKMACDTWIDKSKVHLGTFDGKYYRNANGDHIEPVTVYAWAYRDDFMKEFANREVTEGGI